MDAGTGQGRGAKAAGVTPWILFTIFLFGPCEPLVPMLMYPAATANAWGVVMVALLFSLATIGTMTAMVVALCLGAGAMRFARVGRFAHALAGAVVLSCGMAIKLGL